ncbi:hypothetical protein ACFX1X_045714 [Malus domestica]
MRRAPCCDKNGLKKGPWTTEEDAMLVNYIQKHGPGNWRNLPKNAGLRRCGKSCRLRWTAYLRRFSFEEEETIIQLHSILGNKWAAPSAHDIKNYWNTHNDIKNYWNAHIRKRLLRMGIDPVTHALRIDLLDLSSILSSYVCNNPAAALLNLSNLLKSTQQQQTLVNPELLRLATSLLSIKQENPELCFEGGHLMMLTVFPAPKDCALASFKTKFSATPSVDELDESEKSVAHTASLHTAPCVDLLLKKHERTDGASVLFGVKLRTSTPLVYDLGPEKSTGCIEVFLAHKDCALALLRGELGATLLEELEESEKSALQTQIKIVLQDDRTDR